MCTLLLAANSKVVQSQYKVPTKVGVVKDSQRVLPLPPQKQQLEETLAMLEGA